MTDDAEPQVEPAAPQSADLLARLHRDTRIPPESLVQQVNKGQFTADALGHADTTDLLLSHDPLWTWEPFAVDNEGLPRVMYDSAGRPRALWIWLTVHGLRRPGVGTCSPTAGDPLKELIGDAIRNAAMRFGVGLSLWSKSEWESSDDSQGEDKSNRATWGSGTNDDTPRPGKVSQLPLPDSNDVARHPAAGPSLPPDQMLAMRADQLGLTDEQRQEAISGASGGRTRSGKELRPGEVRVALAAMEAAAKNPAGRGGK